jgi:hypothetical protein
MFRFHAHGCCCSSPSDGILLRPRHWRENMLISISACHRRSGLRHQTIPAIVSDCAQHGSVTISFDHPLLNRGSSLLTVRRVHIASVDRSALAVKEAYAVHQVRDCARETQSDDHFSHGLAISRMCSARCQHRRAAKRRSLSIWGEATVPKQWTPFTFALMRTMRSAFG